MWIWRVNAIGSVTANTALIMGLLILFMPFAVKRRDFAPKAFMMLAAAAILVGDAFSPKSVSSPLRVKPGIIIPFQPWEYYC